MSTFQNRLQQAMRSAGVSTQALADAMGTSYQAIRKAEHGQSKSFSAANNEKAARFLNVTSKWLATGEGPMRAGDDTPGVPPAQPGGIRIKARPILAWETPEDLPEGEFVFVPLLDVRLSAGHGAEQVEIYSDETRPLAFRADWIRQMRLKPGRLLAMWAKGDSMEPRIQNGDALVVDQAQTQVADGGVFALWYEGGERVKRLYRLPGGRLRITSDNPSYGPIELSADEVEHVRIIGRVVHVAGQGGL